MRQARDPFRPRFGPYGTIREREPRRRLPWPLLAVVAAVALGGMALIAGLTRGEPQSSNPPVAGASPTPTAPASPTPTQTPAAPRSALAPPYADPPARLGVPPPEISAASAIVLDGGSLEILFERHAFERRTPASLTKIATAIVAAEHGNLDDVAVSDVHYWTLGDSTTMALEPGDEISIRDLLYGMMLVSGNDAAHVIARHLAGSDEAFAIAMNLLVERLQLEDTRFLNPHGLTQEGHYSTAYDLALLSRHLMANPALYEIVSTEQLIVTALRDGEEIEFDLFNHNPLLEYTPGVDGVKTGFTVTAGRTFAVSVEREGRRLYIVLLDAPERAQDAIALIEWAYEGHEWGRSESGPIPQ